MRVELKNESDGRYSIAIVADSEFEQSVLRALDSETAKRCVEKGVIRTWEVDEECGQLSLGTTKQMPF